MVVFLSVQRVIQIKILLNLVYVVGSLTYWEMTIKCSLRDYPPAVDLGRNLSFDPIELIVSFNHMGWV